MLTVRSSLRLPRLKQFWFTPLYLMWTAPAWAAVYSMDFPVRLNNAEVGQVSASVDGYDLKSVSAMQLKENLQSVLSKDILDWLSSLGEHEVTLDMLQAKGIMLDLKAQDLTIDMSLAEAAMATDTLSYGRKKYFEQPTQEARWALLNNLNLNHERSDNNQSYHSQFEWLINANVGGSNGINMHSSVFWESGSTEQSHVYRGDTAVFYDQPEKPRRFTLGDTQSSNNGHLSGAPLAGFKVASAYSKLQPQRKITPGNSQQFMLPRPATLEIFINEFLISRVRLKAGRYNLNDLPLTSGINNIHVVATYANGETQHFHFTSHYNSRLLAQGVSDYSLAVGFLSVVDDGRYHYDDDALLSGSYEYGVTDKLSLGVNGAAHPQGQVFGSITTFSSPLGNVSLRYSQSKTSDISGNAFSIETEHSIFGHGNYGSPNLRLGYEIMEDFSNSPWLEEVTLSNNKRAFADYSYIINDHIDFTLNATRQVNNEDLVTKNLSAELNFRYEGARVRVGYNHNVSDDPRVVSENQFVLNFTWNHYNRQDNVRTRAQYNNRSKVASVSYAKTNNNYVNDYGYELRAEKGSGYRQEQLKASHTNAFFRADMTASNYTRSQFSSDSSASVNLSSSIGFADGHFGMGATTTTPFAVVTKHKTLKNNDVLVNVDRFGRAQNQPTQHIGALIDLGTGYTNYQFNIDVPNAPLGYDWGPGTYKLVGGANTGHHIQVGSDLSYTVIGTVVDEQGTPIALGRGQVIRQSNAGDSDNAPINRTFFTNRVGRFVVEGISKGSYLIEINDIVGRFTVNDGEKRFIKVGTITLEQAQLQGDPNK
ncbi:fimbria/pilus outer membrane usher protein [Pseudoalteromonas maricaloris]|uniref:fimbria/pilus outer membrane usher protein n=1 Tax=Pseudoalteromonas maricaloris TaxID=184924 RepID=UPI003C1EFD26